MNIPDLTKLNFEDPNTRNIPGLLWFQTVDRVFWVTLTHTKVDCSIYPNEFWYNLPEDQCVKAGHPRHKVWYGKELIKLAVEQLKREAEATVKSEEVSEDPPEVLSEYSRTSKK